MCGKAGRLMVAVVEGVEMQVCAGCAKYGQILRRAKPLGHPKAKIKKPEKEILRLIVNDYAQIVRKAREKLKLSQKEFASRLAEKESIIQKIETKEFKPSIALAEKLEKFLHLTLIETVEVEREKGNKTEPAKSLTIGDLIKLK